jgi:hypothetical protein
MSAKPGGNKQIDEGKAKRRKIAGLISFFVGLPNFALAIVTTFGGIIVTIALAVVIIGLVTGDNGDDPLGALCIVFLVIMFVFALIIAIIFTVISFIFALGVGGQTIGGWYAFKGKNYGRSVTLILIGSLVSILAGIGLLGYGALGRMDDWLRVVLILVGGYDVFAFFLTLVCFVMLLGTKETFSTPEKRPKKKKKKPKRKK